MVFCFCTYVTHGTYNTYCFCWQSAYDPSKVRYKTSRAMSNHIMKTMLPGEKINKVDLQEGLVFIMSFPWTNQLLILHLLLYTELDGDQTVGFYYILL